MTKTPDPSDRLARALAIHHRFLAGEFGRGHAAVLAAHPDLVDLLEPLLSPTSDDLVGDDEVDLEPTLGDYRVIRELGRGGMGVVYEAEQVSLGRFVALKVLPPHRLLDPHAVARFQREARLAGALHHPGITKVFAIGQHGDQPFFSMELVRGRSLDKLIAALRAETVHPVPGARLAKLLAHGIAEGPALGAGFVDTIDFATSVAVQIADALACAHASGVVHRDVKPSNILVRPDGSAVLTDFGIARGGDAISLTLTGDFAGTFDYASPEQLRIQHELLDHRTDIFSLGVTLYELLTRARPFAASTVAEARVRIERQDPKAPSRLTAGVSRDLDAIVQRALEKDPAARYATAAAFAADLRAARAGRPVQARPLGVATRVVRWSRRNPLAACFLATILSGLGVVGVLAREAMASEQVAANRLMQFNSVRVERDVRLLKAAIQQAPPALPKHADELVFVAGELEAAVQRLPGLERILGELRSTGSPTTVTERRRLLTDHPAVEQLARVRAARAEIRRRADDLIRDGSMTEAWEGQVEARLEGLDDDAQRLETLIADRRRFGFDDTTTEYLHDVLEDQIQEIRWLSACWLEHLRRQRDAAVAAARDLTWSTAAAWQEAVAIASAPEPYAGLVLRPRPDLVPLGVDRASGLLEFALPRSGTVPVRGANGDLRLDSGSAVVFVLVPGGTVWIGAQRRDPAAPAYEALAAADEAPQQVRLDPYLLAKHELSHGQCNRLSVEGGPSHAAWYFEGRAGFEDKPVAQVSWNTAMAICRMHGLVLPTEAQWERACRADTRTPWWCGPSPATLEGAENIASRGAPVPVLDPAPYRAAAFGRLSVTALRANPFGFWHMHGNVQEWCLDPWVKDGPMRDGDGLRAGSSEQRAIRGGAYNLGFPLARAAKRNVASPHDSKEILGFRPAMLIDQPQ